MSVEKAPRPIRAATLGVVAVLACAMADRVWRRGRADRAGREVQAGRGDPGPGQGSIRDHLQGPRRSARRSRDEQAGDGQAGEHGRGPESQPLARESEHLLRHDGALQAERGCLQARQGRGRRSGGRQVPGGPRRSLGRDQPVPEQREAPPSGAFAARGRRLGGAADELSPCHVCDDAARAAPRRLAGDQGHAAPVLPGGRQGPAGDDGAAQPLVERAAVRRRPRSHHAPAPSPRHDVRHHPRLRRPRRRRPHRRRPRRGASRCTTGSTSRSSTGACTASSAGSASTSTSARCRSACR